MRILWVSYSASLDGAELSMAESVRTLAMRGHSVHVVLPEDGPLRRHLADAESVRLCWHNRWVNEPGLSVWEKLRWGAFNAFVAGRKIAGIAHAVGAEVVVSNGMVAPTGALAAAWSRKPHAWFLHEYALEEQGLAFHFGRRLSFGFMDRSTDAFLVNSDTCRAQFERWLPREKLHRVHYAAEVPTLSERVNTPRDGGCRVVLVGRRSRPKGTEDAIVAVGVLAAAGVDVELELIGGGEPTYDDELRRLAATSGANGRIRFVDAHDGHFLRVADADVALMCSRCDAFGRVTIEAMKLGKPVVGAAAGATPELIRHGWNGLLYKPGAADELADHIKRLVDDPTLARALGERGRAWALQTFNRDVHAVELEHVLEPIASDQRPRRVLRR